MLTDGASPVPDAKELIRRGQNRLAAELLEPWVEHNAEDASAWSALAAALFNLGDFPEALAASERVVGLRGQARDWCNYGMLLRKSERLDDAERALYKALTLNPHHEHARTELEKVHQARTAEDGEDYL